uniref:Tub domain-containing protein n=1 Tax=Elaeophora elaphi TaxID=1147741 RepID=A0A0R3RUR5_9BILA
MKIIWESDDWPGCVVDSSITCLNWIPNGNNADTGLLATGSESGAVGVTVTEACPLQDDNRRVNFHLRGHHTAVNIVAWNKEQMKLASCDSSGIIYVWVPNEERWSVELVNDRGIKVRGVSWSPNGSSALICYEDNFVLIGSATGQRIWSSSFPVTVNCGVWAPDSREIILGFNNGTIQVLNEQGATVTERKMYVNGIVRFLAASSRRRDGRWTLAMCSGTGLLNFLNSYDEIDNAKWQCNETLLSIQWNANGTQLAAVCKENHFFIITYQGNVVCDSRVSQPSTTALTAFTWVHDDRFIIATSGNHLAVGRVLHDVPSLFNLVTYNLWQLLGGSALHVDVLPLPPRERNAIRALDHHIIRCRVPSQNDMLMKVCEPSDWRWYCTIRPVPSKVHTYVLCMEHMAGLIPVLLGKQTNRIIPQFQISLYNPKLTMVKSDNGSSAQVEDVGAFTRPSTQRNSVWRRSKRQLRALMNRYVACPVNRNNGKLVQITSNVWCTRFKMLSVTTNILPTFLAQSILSEFNDLKVAVERHIAKMKCFASDLERSSQKLDSFGGTTSVIRYVSKVSTRTTALPKEVCVVSPGMKTQRSELTYIEPSTSSNRWSQQFDDIEVYIDEDDAIVMRDTTERTPLIDCFKATETSRKGMRQLSDITSVLDKLAKLANDLTTRCAVGQLSSDESSNAMNLQSSPYRCTDDSIKESHATVSSLRSQLKDISKKVSQIEKKISYGDELLDEVCGDLQERIQHIKAVLGEQPALSDENISFLTMNNKAPFWNEASQVYQLDFGGRVTQESAKNFQIEYDDQQVMQFGRIENGAYTLDFRSPFSAVQAFAVALASITQRLK